MMRRRIGRLAAAAVATAAFVVPMAVKGVIPNPSMLSVNYTSWLVQAYDECPVTPFSTIISGVQVCASSAESTKTFRMARVMVSRTSNRVLLIGSGFPSSQAVRLRFTVRSSTRSAPLLTYIDYNVTCPATTCTSSGVCIQRTDLGTCIGPGAEVTRVATGRNIEILSAELVESPSLDVIGRPGIIR
ncbi:MAG: hypothetical protein HY699_06030 [Deltaproteobacteria bacterium]|nr:hypothetical protein [Deltaproteobacteria bacterium]